jgi:TonB family protein
VLEEHAGDIGKCYPETQPEQLGLELYVERDGTVVKAAMRQSPLHGFGDVESCVLEGVHKWSFDSAAASTHVWYSLRFEPTGVKATVLETGTWGSLDKELIHQVIRKNLGGVQGCYARDLVKRPELAGRTTVQITISRGGRVRDARVLTSTLGSVPVEECVTSIIRSWSFPEPQGGGDVIVSYPFLFRRTAQGDAVAE